VQKYLATLMQCASYIGREIASRPFSLTIFLHKAMSRLPDFSWSKDTKTVKIYQMAANYTKWPQTIPNGYTESIPNGRQIFQMMIKDNHIFHSQALQIYQNLIFCLKINHLATLGYVLLWNGFKLTKVK
jgi:hypothetical protein